MEWVDILAGISKGGKLFMFGMLVFVIPYMLLKIIAEEEGNE